MTYRGDLDPALKARLRDIFLNAHKDIQVAGYGNLTRYKPASPEDYQIIRDMVRELGIKKSEIIK